MKRGAVFDPRGRYRYALTRRWADGGARVAMIGLNPSTADAEKDDPTLRRCIGFAQRLGFHALEVVNLFAWRATKPRDLFGARDPVGRHNDAHLLRAARKAQAVVLIWGVHGARLNRDARVLSLLSGLKVPLTCFGLTRHGHPKHVLYLPADTPLSPFPERCELD